LTFKNSTQKNRNKTSQLEYLDRKHIANVV